MWQLFKSDHERVADFKKGRERQLDEEFILECELANDSKASEIAVGVRRAIAKVGLIDPLFIRASDRFPEELGILPLWDSMDWTALILELEEELAQQMPDPILYWKPQNSFIVKQLVHAV